MIEVHLKATRMVGNLSFDRVNYMGSGPQLEEVFAAAVEGLCSTHIRPTDEKESLLIERVGPAYHTTLGVRTFNVSERTTRRAQERAWPEGAPSPGVYRKAAFLLLVCGHATIRLSPFTGLTATRG